MGEAFKQKTVGCMLVAGLVISVVSFGLMWLFAVSGIYTSTYNRDPTTGSIGNSGTTVLVPIMLTFMCCGLALIAGAVGYGLWLVKNEHSGPRRVVEHFRVLARYAYDRHMNYMQDDGMIEFSEGVRFYVRAHEPGGEMLEYESTEEVWRSCGEGMYGEAELQGKWIGRFTPYIGVPDATPER